MSLEEASREWAGLLGADRVLDRAAAEQAFGWGTTGDRRVVAAALRPRHREEVAGIVRIAARHGVPLFPISTGRNWGYGCAVPARDGCAVLDLADLRSIEDFDPELGTVTIEPGVTQGILAEFLRANGGRFLVPVSGAGPDCSILANALERGYGITPMADHFAAAMQIEAVLPDGETYSGMLANLGGTEIGRLFKWGVGPFLDGLFAQGSLGVVTRMSVALARRPEAVRAFVFGVDDPSQLASAVGAVREILARFPAVVGGINLMNAHRVLAMAAPYPLDGAGPNGLLRLDVVAGLCSTHGISPWTVFGTLYGTRAVVRAAAREVRRHVRPFASRLMIVSPGQAEFLASAAARLPGALVGGLAARAKTLATALELVDGRPNETAMKLVYWKGAGRMPPPGVSPNPTRDGCGLIWYTPLIPMKADRVASYVDFATSTMREHGIEPLITLTSVSERCFDSSVPLLFDPASPRQLEDARRCYRALLEKGSSMGFVPYRFGLPGFEWVAERAPAALRLADRIKAALDPQRIIAPGRYSL